MILVDFTYDSKKASDYGVIPCYFDEFEQVVDVGNEIKMTTVKPAHADRYRAVAVDYEDVFTKEFAICKDPCKFEGDEVYFTDTEINSIMRWLNRKEYLDFQPVYDDGSFEGATFHATFNVDVVMLGGHCVGFNLLMTTDAPYAFRNKQVFEISQPQSGFNITPQFDIIGFLYADAEITCTQAGDLRISSSMDPTNTIEVKNVVAGEVIKLYGQTKWIESSVNHADLFNDFNFKFFRLRRSIYQYDDNFPFASNQPIKIKVTYEPVWKVGVI